MLKLVLVVLLVVLVVGFVAGAMAVSSVNDARDHRLRRQLEGYKLEAKAQERQAKLAAGQRGKPPLLAQPIPSRGKVNQPARSTGKTAGFATRPPENDFIPLCECPHCGWLDAHFLRVPIHPPPPEPEPEPAPSPQPEKSWWGSVVGWFGDEKKDAPEEPTQQEGQPEKSWWDSVAGWFDDDPKPQDSTEKPDTAPEPTADHPDARVVRTCRSCGHDWAQR